jgi:lysophospholipase L1-like esterase
LYTLVGSVRNRAAQNLVLLFVIVLSLLVFTEHFLKHTMPVEIAELTFENFRASSNPKIVLEPRPGAGEFNSRGIRDREYEYEKPEGVRRVVVIGDSLAFGWGVARDESYAEVLEKNLNRSGAEREKFEVINMGVPGYRTVQIVERLKDEGLKYDPDLIVYGYWLDDITFSGFTPFSLSRANVETSEKIQEMMAGSPLERGIKKVLLKSQILRRAIFLARELRRKSLAREQVEAAGSPPPGGAAPADPEIIDLHRQYQAAFDAGEYRDLPGSESYYRSYTRRDDFLLWNGALGELAGLCRERGIPCLLVMTPVIYDYSVEGYNWEALNRFIRAVAEHHSISVIDLTEDFGRHDSFRLRGKDSEHPSAFGHELVAGRLHDWLRNKGWVN